MVTVPSGISPTILAGDPETIEKGGRTMSGGTVVPVSIFTKSFSIHLYKDKGEKFSYSCKDYRRLSGYDDKVEQLTENTENVMENNYTTVESTRNYPSRGRRNQILDCNRIYD